MTETQWRFLKAIAERVPGDAIVELRMFPAIRQGGMESGVAVVAVEAIVEGSDATAGAAPVGGEVASERASRDAAGAPDPIGGDLQPSEGARSPAAEESHPTLRAAPTVADIGDVTEVVDLVEIAAVGDAGPPPRDRYRAHAGDPRHPFIAEPADLSPQAPEVMVEGRRPLRKRAPSRAVPSAPTADETAVPIDVATESGPESTHSATSPELTDERVVTVSVASDDAPAEPEPDGPVPTLDDLLGSASAPPEQPERARPVVKRFSVLAARYRLTLKGPERGKWDFEITHEADAPLETVERVARGVARRAGDEGEPERLSASDVRATLSQPWWTTAT